MAEPAASARATARASEFLWVFMNTCLLAMSDPGRGRDRIQTGQLPLGASAAATAAGAGLPCLARLPRTPLAASDLEGLGRVTFTELAAAVMTLCWMFAASAAAWTAAGSPFAPRIAAIASARVDAREKHRGGEAARIDTGREGGRGDLGCGLVQRHLRLDFRLELACRSCSS